jgi:hypothetical protein
MTSQHPGTAPAPGLRWPRLGPRVRRVTLIVHLASVAAWFGMHVVLGVMTFAALGGPAASAPAFATSIAMFVGWPLIAAALLTLLSGLALAVGSKYGLLRYWWVATKLVLTGVLITLVLLVLIPSVAELAAAASEPGFALDQQLIAPPIVSSGALLFTIAISVIKPWGRTRR